MERSWASALSSIEWCSKLCGGIPYYWDRIPYILLIICAKVSWAVKRQRHLMSNEYVEC